MKDLYAFTRKFRGNEQVDRFSELYFTGDVKPEFKDFTPLNEESQCSLVEDSDFSYIAVKRGNSSYAVVSSRVSGSELFDRITEMMNEGMVDELQEYLEGEGSVYMIPLNESIMSYADVTLEGNFFKYKGKVYEVDGYEKGCVLLKLKGSDEVTLRVSKKVLEKQAYPVLNESTQTTNMSAKVDTGSKEITVSEKDSLEGRSYQFEDGIFRVDFVNGYKVYLIGPDNEYYVIGKKDFYREMIKEVTETPMNEESVEIELDTYAENSLFINLNGVSKICTSKELSGEELFKRVGNLIKVSEGKALAWLKHNTEIEDV